MDCCIIRVLDERVSNFVAGALFGYARRWTFRSVVFSGLRASTPIAKSKTAYCYNYVYDTTNKFSVFYLFSGEKL